MRWLLTSMVKRQKLYHYLRELTDDHGRPGDVGARWVEQLTSWSDQYVSEKDGFKPEEVAHINSELGHIYRLKFKAYGHVRSI